MKQKLSLIGAVLLIGTGLLFAAGAVGIVSTPNGLVIGAKPVTKLCFFTGCTPVVKQAATATPLSILQLFGLVSSGTDWTEQHKQALISAANLTGMYATPVQIVPTPGAGKTITVTRAALRITRSPTAYTGGGAVILQYDSTANGAGTNSLDSTIAATVVTGAAATSDTFRNGAVISDNASIANKGLFLSNATAAFATGTGTGTLDLWYRVY